ncbi:hypothetical protein OZX69_01485 [Lactobacillus sp. ESL0731]|uniref:hypothetical protein n=1 Tax=unclassified Lactobacillus TaxID=2620435 RepID=UPI0023F94185|nr:MULTISPECIES: hypothetical protein [unclassified Lactobacillus]WEV51422.1 hypothetical protein OZX63_01485 [Lactobacillus sp. ESL0700]WEV62552.1 hypothetical protein OZX69_01485 [Lactobacillus sp. ESL0731]
MKVLNGRELCRTFGFSTTLLYKFRKSGMPYHQIEGDGSRAYYIADEVENWLRQAGFHQEIKSTWSK